MIEDTAFTAIEKALQAHFQAPDPDPEFLAALEKRLLVLPEVLPARAPSTRRLRWRFALIAAVLSLVGTVLAIGPDRVWAALQRWAGYLPGIGVVELSGARALPAPVGRTSRGVTFTVERLVASPDQTIVVARIVGLDLRGAESPWTIRIGWSGGSGLRGRAWMSDPFYPACDDQDCPSEPAPVGYVVRAAFEALPAETDRVTVVWTTPGSALGGASEEWSFDLELQPIDSAAPDQWMVVSYIPRGARDSHHGIDLVVTRVFQDSQATLVEMQMEVPDDVALPSLHGVELTSDLGTAYLPSWVADFDLNGLRLVTATPAAPGGPTRTLWPDRRMFTPGEPTARQLTLHVEGIRAGYESDFEFPVMIRQAPSAGQILPLDVSFEVDGFRVHVDQARIVEAAWMDLFANLRLSLTIELHVDSPVEQGGRRLREIWLDPQFNQVHAEPFVDPATGVLTERLAWDPVFTPLDPLTIRIDRVTLDVEGPWVVSWPVREVLTPGVP
jgi:hypothetical protein